MRSFEERLAFYIRNQLIGQPIQTYQELYKRVVEVEQVKSELSALNLGHQKRKWNNCGTSSESAPIRKLIASTAKSRPTVSTEPCLKCGILQHSIESVLTNACGVEAVITRLPPAREDRRQ